MRYRPGPTWHFFLLFLRQFYREPSALFWSFGFPLLAALLMVPAMDNNTRTRFRIGVQTSAPIDARLVEVLRTDPLFVPVPVSLPSSEATSETMSPIFMRHSLDALVTERGLFMPQGGSGGAVLERLLQSSAEKTVTPRFQISRVALMGQRFSDWFVPGLIGLGLLSNGLFFVAVRIVLERSTGLFRRLKLTPFKRRSYLGGFASAYTLLCMLQTALLTLAFNVTAGFRIQGRVVDFIAVATLGGAVFGLLGLAIAARVKSVHVASGVANLFYFPMMFLCGVYFRAEYFPQVMHPFLRILPLTVLNNGLRSIANGGVSVFALSQELAVLIIWGVVCLLFVVRFFNWGKE